MRFSCARDKALIINCKSYRDISIVPDQKSATARIRAHDAMACPLRERADHLITERKREREKARDGEVVARLTFLRSPTFYFRHDSL